MQTKIIDALARLDAENPNHWTADGHPSLDVVRLFAEDSTITRKQIVSVAPNLNRDSQTAAPDEPALPVVVEVVSKELANSEIDDKRAEFVELVKQLNEAQRKVDDCNAWLDLHVEPVEQLSQTLQGFFKSINGESHGV